MPVTLDRYIDAVLRRRWLTALLALAVMLAVASGASLLTFSNDHRDLFSEDNPQLVAFDALENTYSKSTAALIAVAPREGTVFTRAALAAIEELTEAAWRTPRSIRVNSLTNHNHSEAEGDDLLVAPLVEDAQSLTDADIARVRRIALETPELAGRLVSRDGRVGALAITFALPEDSSTALAEVTDGVAAMLDKARDRHPDMRYYVTGDISLSRALADAAENDIENLFPIVFLVILVVTALLLRSALATLAIVATLLFTVGTTMGFAGWIGTVLTPVDGSVPVIVITIAVAHSIHIAATALSGLRRGMDRREAVAESLRINAWPVFLSTVTTIVGFLSLNTSDSPPFRMLGNLMAFGVLCTFVYSMTLLPALLAILPLRTRQAGAGSSNFFDRFGAFVVARRTLLLVSTALLAAVMAAGVARIEFTENWTRYLDESYEFRRDTDFVLANLTGLETWEYSLRAGREGGITDPDYLRKVDAFAGWLRKQPEVSHVQAFPDIMKRLNRNMHGDDPAHYRLPDNPDLAAQYLLLFELSLPAGSDLNDRIDVAKSATRLTATARGSLSAKDQRGLDARSQAWLRANAPQLATEATGISMVTAYLSQRNINSLLIGMTIAMGLISLILLWVFKSVRLGLVSLAPNFVPLIVGFGVWGYFVGSIGLGGAVTAVFAFGIIVDDTIHFLSEYRRSRGEGLAAPEAVRSAFRTVGRALWTTTAALTAGFLVLAGSGFESSWTLGAMTSIIIAFALLADFLLLPPLLMAFDRTKEQ